ncbi:hypothetical protein ULMS_00430 [Patiriisocius marinistellae]|uniref:Uncharacterized protein n=1 Tax=Patiriisocius marinistellae TaxID=2494560 RepID=A0A5J4FWW4_9FLAO|nr:hypothetical protein ULMS_00430 [Patiriisocius marinistellae]
MVSRQAFNKKITKDFSYLILGENSPQQGLSLELNEKGSNLKLSGVLFTGKVGVLTLEADLAASNGVYFFDEQNGSEQGKISFNLFRNVWSKSGYNAKSPIEETKTKLATLQLVVKAIAKYDTLKSIITTTIPSLAKTDIVRQEKVETKLLTISKRYINDQHVKGYEAMKVLSKSMFDPKDYQAKKNSRVILPNIIPTGTTNAIAKNPLEITDLYRDEKLISDYIEQQNYIMEKLENEIIALESKDAEAKWTSTQMIFVGLTPYYQRESFKRFTLDESLAFSKMFDNETGDIYGITGSFNFNYERGSYQHISILPDKVFCRLTGGANRASNISSFRNSTLNLSSSLGNDVSGNPIIFTNDNEAYIGDATYEYGIGSTFSIDLYYYPFPLPVGVFGSFGYQFINFSSSKNIDDKEISPMRIGLLFDIKNAKKDSPIITVQGFIDRTDLSLSPNGKDDDLRFGIGVGLPINFK